MYLSLSLLGLLPPGTQFDLFRGTAAMKQDVEDMYPTTLAHTIKVIFFENKPIFLSVCMYLLILVPTSRRGRDGFSLYVAF